MDDSMISELSLKGIVLFSNTNSIDTEYFGTIEILGQQFFVSLRLENGRPNSQSFMCDDDLRNLLKPLMSTVSTRLAQADTLKSFFLDLRQIAETAMRTESCSDKCHQRMTPPDYYSRLISELEEVGWEALGALNDSLSEIEVNLKDAAQRTHKLLVQLPSDYPQSAPQIVVDLPEPMALRWNSGQSRIINCVNQFHQCLKLYQNLWEVMDDIDKHTWVLEPERPHQQRGITFRRIAIHPHASVVITVDPARPRGLCDMRFLGSESSTNPLKQRLSKGLHKWDSKRLPRKNLEHILDLAFPSPQTSKKEDFSSECGICYSYRLIVEDEQRKPAASTLEAQSGSIPDCICNNEKCSRAYHPQCLFQWLQALPSSRISFDTIFGQCVYCHEPMSLKTPR